MNFLINKDSPTSQVQSWMRLQIHKRFIPYSCVDISNNSGSCTIFMTYIYSSSYMASFESRLWVGMHRALVSSSTASPRSKTAAAPMPEPMHMEITPNRQSLPRRFISLRRVLTDRAPAKRKHEKYHCNWHICLIIDY
jgi:hypothetical protein